MLLLMSLGAVIIWRSAPDQSLIWRSFRPTLIGATSRGSIPRTSFFYRASTLLEVGEYLGFSGQYATRIARNEIRAAVAALNAAMAVEDREAA